MTINSDCPPVESESIRKDRVRRPGLEFAAILLFTALIASVSVLLSMVRKEQIKSFNFAPPPSGMVFVAPGDFFMGSDDQSVEPDEWPRKKLFLSGFYIDRYEVTNQQYRRFNPEHDYRVGDEHLPVTGVLRDDAEACCRNMGKRLPTGREWEKAARGDDGRNYPWGNKILPGMANIRYPPGKTGQLLPVGSYPGGVSPYGCYDMSGNAWEWVSDEIVVRNSDSGAADQVRGVIRGGGFNYSPFQARTSYQGFEDPNLTCNDVGFRCVQDAIVEKR